MPHDHLLLFSLGPVQDFIAAARRCQDLWFGSYLLSQLSRVAAQGIADLTGRQNLIFPGALGNDKAAVANKILALAPSRSNAVEAAESAKEAVESELTRLAQDHWPDPNLEVEKYFNRELAKQQLKIEELMEIAWVIVPGAEQNYAKARLKAEALLASRKNTKDWAPQRSSELFKGIPKSSLDGLRESVIREEAYDELTPEDLYKHFKIKNGTERLCGVALLKRRGAESDQDKTKRPAFHSTSHLAAAPLLTRLTYDGNINHPELAKYLERFGRGEGLWILPGNARKTAPLAPPPPFAQPAECLEVQRTFGQEMPFLARSLGIDGTAFFEERLAPDVFGQTKITRKSTDEARRAAKKQKEKAMDAQKTLIQLRQELKLPAPDGYYALLLADGDSMGKAIEALAKGDEGWKAHQNFSEELDSFATSTGAIVEAHGGSLIYAGGDDVFALLPLHTALAAARAIQSRFDELNTTVQGLKAKLSLSAGLAIVHHLTPMTEARRLAKEAEGVAKDKAGRDALAIILDKRNGVTLTISDKWDNGLDERLNQWAHLIHHADLPNGLAYELEKMVETFESRGCDSSENANTREELKDAVKALAKQIINRKRTGEDEGLSEGTKDLLHKSFKEDKTPRIAIRNLSAELQVSRALLKAYTIAWGPKLDRKGGQHD